MDVHRIDLSSEPTRDPCVNQPLQSHSWSSRGGQTRDPKVSQGRGRTHDLKVSKKEEVQTRKPKQVSIPTKVQRITPTTNPATENKQRSVSTNSIIPNMNYYPM